MKYDFIIFGGTGQQGGICARDLIESGYSVLLVGRDKTRIKNLLKNKKTGFIEVDLRNEEEIAKAIKSSNAEVVVNCAELIFNVAIMKACLKTKKSLTDLGGLQKITLEQFKLHDSFKKTGIINITGCGSTPGIVNVMTAHVLEKLDSVKTIYLGFVWDSNIKKFVVPYSIQSIFDEFTENPITYHDGKFVKEKRMTCKGTKNFKEVGKQTVYCIVHSEVYSFSKYFKNKGLKNIHYMAGFPEHSMKAIQTLIDLGFNSEEPIKINEKEIKPINFTTEVLKKIKWPKNYMEVENLWVEICGKKNNKDIKIEMNCIVKSLPGWEDAGSNVDTGRTISVISQMLKDNLIKEKGVYAPEAVVPCKHFFKELAKRKMYIYENGKKIN
ncbi:MAG: saccharopine dehydrogenase [archaeon GW2011_AR19]|nr:MAG: saccharopine dehydrogenase [archaeon GW2011_AR19]